MAKFMSICKELFECRSSGGSTSSHAAPSITHKTMVLNEWHLCLTKGVSDWRQQSKQKISIHQNAQKIRNSGYLKLPGEF